MPDDDLDIIAKVPIVFVTICSLCMLLPCCIQLPYFYLLNTTLEYDCVVAVASMAADGDSDGAGWLLIASLDAHP